MLTIKQLLSEGAFALQERGLESAFLDARILLEFVLSKSHEYIIANSQVMVSRDVIAKFNALIARRINFEPIAYILGYKEFYGREFFVNKNVLIPRSDTETLIDAVLDQVNNNNNLKILELGVGSGCIIITLLLELTHAKGVAIDISELALELLQKNISRYKLDNRLKAIKSNWFAELVSDKFDLIVTNPPYIDKTERILMNDETIKYEPSLALFAKEKGLINYKIIAQNAKNYLSSKGVIVMEVGYKQAARVKHIFANNDYIHIETYRDLAEMDRIMVFKSN